MAGESGKAFTGAVNAIGSGDLKTAVQLTKKLVDEKKKLIQIDRAISAEQKRQFSHATAEKKRLIGLEKDLANEEKKRLAKLKKDFDRFIKHRFQQMSEKMGVPTAVRKSMEKYGELGQTAFDKIAHASTQAAKAIKRSDDETEKAKDGMLKLTKALSKVNVQYFTFTNILHDVESGLERASDVMIGMMRNIISAGAELEKFERTVVATEANWAAGQKRLNDIIELGLQLVGVSTQAMIKYNAQLRAAGLSAKQVDLVLTGVAKSMAELGKGTQASERVLLQLTQALAGNKIILQDLRPILEETPGFWRAATIAFGEVIQDIEKFREVVKANDLQPREGLLKVLAQINKAAQGADMQTFAAQVDVLNDRFFLLRAELGQALLPVVVLFTEVISNIVQWFRNLNDGVKRFIAEGLLFLTVAIVSLNVACKNSYSWL